MAPWASKPIEAFFDSLSNELVVEILLRLPLKSAHRCKCVSKLWFSLISDHYFAHKYMHHHTNSSRAMSTLLVQGIPHPDWKDPDLTVCSISKEKLFKFRGFFSFLREQSATGSLHILASCNDLVLCRDEFWYQSEYYYICNPLTKQWVGFPRPSNFHKNASVGLICDYCNDQGLTSITTRCKVVRIPKFDGSSTTFKVEIFSFETRQWSELLLSCPRGFGWTPSSAVVCNGMLHWLSCDSNRKQVTNGIVAYNPYNNSTGQCHFIDLPEDTNFFIQTTSFGVCQGHLSVSHMSTDNRYTLRVWELKEFEWCLKHKADLNRVISEGHITSMIAFDPSDEDVVYLKRFNDIFLFEMKRKKLKMVFSRAKRAAFWGQFMVIPFVLPSWPTLVPMLQPDEFQC